MWGITIVQWTGDVRCRGRTGTLGRYFTVVEKGYQGRFSVLPNVKQTDIRLVSLDSMHSENELLHLSGVAYGPDDHKINPALKMRYSLKFDSREEQFVVLEKVELIEKKLKIY